MLSCLSLLVFIMMTVQLPLGVSLFVLLFLDVHGVPLKGVPKHQSSSDPKSGGHVSSHRRAVTGHTAPVSYGVPAGVFQPAPSHPQFLQAEPMVVGVSSMPESASSTSSASVPVASGYAGGVPGYAGSVPAYVPVQAAYLPGYDAGSQQTGAAQASLPEAKWAIAPQSFEEASTSSQAQGSSAFLPPPPPPGPPALQSGETSNVVKEAELGNYHQQTEEFGYPADRMGSGQGFPVVAMPGLGVGGLWGYPSPYPLPYSFPYPDFDYRLLYGLYPPGTYTTFSRNHEKGTDYFQDIHYLKEHESDVLHTPQNPGSGQQKVFPAND